MDKKAFVFDTNLDEALDKLKEQFFYILRRFQLMNELPKTVVS